MPWIVIAILLFNERITFSEVTVLSVAALSIPSSLTKLLNGVTTFHSQSRYVENLKSIMEYPENTECDKNDAIDAPAELSINVKNVVFSYDKDERKVLKDISMEIPFGKKVVFVGNNGSGKSTMVKLLARLYQVDSGEIEFNGVNIENYKIKSLRRKIALLSQDVKIYSFSIAENVLMRPIASEKDEQLVRTALIKVGLWSKIENLPNGIYTFVTREFDENGAYFSGGELQKLALARIYVSECSCIIMDESTSALDPASEDEIIKTLLSSFNDKTIIFISHRLGIVDSVDCVYYFSDGKLECNGKHSELMLKNVKYAEFYRKQADKF